MISLTALILTFNEKENIRRVLSALSWLDGVVIVDSLSTDETLEIARASHPNVIAVRRPFDTHATQWNFGLAQVKTEWVLSLDADYEVSSKLANEIQSLDPSPDVVGYEADFEYRIFGHPLRASVYPSRVVLFRPGQCSYYDDGHAQRLRTNGVIRSLNGKIYHDDRKPFKRWIDSQHLYAKLEARHLLSTPSEQLNFQDRLRRRIVFAPPAMFSYLLFVRGLILDGWPGWFYVFQRTLAEMLLSIRLLSEQHELELRGADK
jgi:glycosyltransferase involved in cell wall biosynthesis